MGVAEFVFSALTDFVFVPALFQVARHKRHFEMFIGIFQLIAAFMFNSSKALDASIFLSQDDWHTISDVMTLSYVLCLLVHLSANANENVNITLRYVGFALAWIFKLRDNWDSGVWEGALIFVFLGIVGYCNFVNPRSLRDEFHYQSLQIASATLIAAVIFLAIELSTGGDSYGIAMGLMHTSAGASVYFWYKAVPVFDVKPLRNSFV